MNKYETYFGQVITDDELNEIFNSFASAIESFIQDFGYSGIAVGADLVQNPTPNMAVSVSAPGVVYDQFGNRTSFGSALPVNCTADENNATTAVVGTGNSKWLSVFIKYVLTPSDPRVDDLGDTIYFRKSPSYVMHVAQGAEASGSLAVRPPLRSDQILLGDIKVTYGQTSIANADIDLSRRQVIYNIPGTPLSVKAKALQAVLQAVVTAINNINSGTLLMPPTTGSPASLPGGSINTVIKALLDLINSKANPGDIPPVPGDPDYSGFAFLSPNQTFTGINDFHGINLNDLLFSKVADHERGILGTTVEPGSSRWHLVFDFKWGGGQYWLAYTGNDASTRGCYLMCTNARWDGTKWVVRDIAFPSVALIFTWGRIRISSKTGSADWTEWPSDLPENATSNQRGLHIVDSVNVNESVTVGANLTVNERITGKAEAEIAENLTVGGSILAITGGGLIMGKAMIAVSALTVGGVTGSINPAATINGPLYVHGTGAKIELGPNADIKFNPGKFLQRPINILLAQPMQADSGNAYWILTYDKTGSRATLGEEVLYWLCQAGQALKELQIPIVLPYGAVLFSIDLLVEYTHNGGNGAGFPFVSISRQFQEFPEDGLPLARIVGQNGDIHSEVTYTQPNWVHVNVESEHQVSDTDHFTQSIRIISGNSGDSATKVYKARMTYAFDTLLN